MTFQRARLRLMVEIKLCLKCVTRLTDILFSSSRGINESALWTREVDDGSNKLYLR